MASPQACLQACPLRGLSGWPQPNQKHEAATVPPAGHAAMRSTHWAGGFPWELGGLPFSHVADASSGRYSYRGCLAIVGEWPAERNRAGHFRVRMVPRSADSFFCAAPLDFGNFAGSHRRQEKKQATVCRLCQPARPWPSRSGAACAATETRVRASLPACAPENLRSPEHALVVTPSCLTLVVLPRMSSRWHPALLPGCPGLAAAA